MAEECIFCNIEAESKDKFIGENANAFAVYDNFPVNKGHTLVIAKRHVSSFFEATDEEIMDIMRLVKEMKIKLDNEYKPDGYNIGINVHEAAGQTIMHLHLHLIPRYTGDVKNPRGGIRKLKMSLVGYED